MTDSREFGVVEQRTWEVVTKAPDGEATVHELHYERKLPEVSPEEYESLFVRQAPPSRITPTKRQKPSRRDKLTAIVPDVQIGYRGDEAFHDERAIALAHLAIRETQPDEIVVIGDLLDLPSVSKYQQRPDWMQTVQRSIDRGHTLLGQLRSDAPDAQITMLGANHERRFEDYIIKNASELLGIKRANARDELSVLTLDYLLRLGELGVTYLSGYPNSRHWIQPNIQAVHGTFSGKAGATASRLLHGATMSTVQGHAHKQELAFKQVDGFEPRTIWGMVVGTLCRTDGGVPSHDHTVDTHNQTVTMAYDWTQGLAMIESNERVSQPTLMPITEDGVYVYGRNYTIAD